MDLARLGLPSLCGLGFAAGGVFSKFLFVWVIPRITRLVLR